MAERRLHIIAVDPRTGEIAWQCTGPDERGACGRVAIGAEVPCIGKALSQSGSAEEPYVVPRLMTLCPYTLAAALDVSVGRDRRVETGAAA